MTTTNNSTSQPSRASLIKRMLVGTIIGLIAILFFLIGAQADPAWGKLWMIRPLIITPMAGAMGGLCNYYIMQYHSLAGANKVVAMIVSAIVFVIGLWLGIVLGLDGTLWD